METTPRASAIVAQLLEDDPDKVDPKGYLKKVKWSRRCKHCKKRIKPDQHVWVDDTGGDVCGWDGGNEPHEPE